MRYMIYDLETEVNELHKRRASCFDPRNWVVAYGWKVQGEKIKGLYYTEPLACRESDFKIPDDVTLLVGFNIKFDNLWIWDTPTMRAFIQRGGKIWCCQYAEYLLEGQQAHAQMCSMDSVAEKYGGTLKLDVVKEMWKAGVKTADIPEDVLMEYLLEGDIPNTEAIFLGQLQRANMAGQTKMISTRMDGLLCSTEMEYNGLYVNKEKGLHDAEQLQEQLIELRDTLHEQLPAMPEELVFNWNSRYHLSALLFGGTAKYSKWVHHRCPLSGKPLYAQSTEARPVLDELQQPVRYKSGKRAGEVKTKNHNVDDLTRPKGAKQDFGFPFPTLVHPDAKWKASGELFGGGPVYSTGADVIEQIGQRTSSGIPGLLAQAAKLDKDLSTYYINTDGDKGMLTLIGDDGICHHGLNHVTTKTSRMSGSNPNMQNIPRGDKSTVKTLFSSRFGANGQMLEIDYSQLEIVIQAWITGCENMIADVNAGVDFHCKRLAAKLNQDYDYVVHKCKVEHDSWYVQQRTLAKAFTFQRAYGAGAKAIAEDLGVPVEEIEALITAEEALYPGVTLFDQSLECAITKSSTDTRNRKREAHPIVPGRFRTYALGEWFGPTGTRFVWRQWDAPAYLQKRGIDLTFSPTERKNWPIQGYGGEIMQISLGRIFRLFVDKGWWSGGQGERHTLLVNTVHDCIWVDSGAGIMEEVLESCKKLCVTSQHSLKKDITLTAL